MAALHKLPVAGDSLTGKGTASCNKKRGARAVAARCAWRRAGQLVLAKLSMFYYGLS
jgi:hypothetical protein